MKILYFDTFSLLYSHQYVNSAPAVTALFEQHRFKPRGEFLELVEPDFASAKRLADTAFKFGFLLFPAGTRYTREMLISAGVFDDSQLAPDVELTWKLRLDDASPIRRILAHASSLGVEKWYACGDIAHIDDWNTLTDHYIPSNFGLGVDDDLVSAIGAKCQHI